MNGRGRLLCVMAAFTFFVFSASAQEAISVDQTTLNQHVDHRVTPVYPPIAKAAHIQGTVVFKIRVGVSGKIESMKVVSGPAMLQQAAMDCLKQWSYYPFEKGGVPIAATGPVSIMFILSDYHPAPDDEQIAAQYFPLFNQCSKAVSARIDAKSAEDTCEKAGETAEKFGPEVRFIEKRSAFVYAATACADNRDLPNALTWAEKAVDVVKLGHDDDSGSSAAYSTKGTIEGMIGDLSASDHDLTVAEDYGRKGIAWAEKEAPSLRPEYVRSFVRDLQFHAKVLQALGRPNEAQKKLDEAAKFN
ncbi:MAG: energy transducer TonB [Terracidiphilus sp.]|jgi:TonB family protein